jgi:hypothetical protein
MKLGGVSSAEAALALVRAFGYSGRPMLTLRDATDDPEAMPVPTWRHAAGPMHLDWDDSEAVTPVVFVGGYRDSARELEAPPTRVDVRGPDWLVPFSRAVVQLLSLS